MEEILENKDLEAYVSFGFVLNGQIGDLFKLRHFINGTLQTRVLQELSPTITLSDKTLKSLVISQSRVIYHTFSRNPLFLVGYNDLSEEKKNKLKEVKRDDKKDKATTRNYRHR